MASLITSNLVAAAGPPVNAPAPLPTDSTPAPTSSFGSVLNSTVSERSAPTTTTPPATGTGAATPATPTTAPATGTATTTATGTTATTTEDAKAAEAARDLAASAAAATLLVPTQLPTAAQPTPATGQTGANAATATAAQTGRIVRTDSRTQQLRFQNSSAVLAATTNPTQPTTAATTQRATTATVPTAQTPIPATATTPEPPRTVTTAATPTDTARAAAVIPAVVPQAAVVVNLGQGLPVPPAEVGAGLVRPPVPEPAAVGGLPAVAQTDRSAVRQEFPNIVHAVAANVTQPTATPQAGQPFAGAIRDAQAVATGSPPEAATPGVVATAAPPVAGTVQQFAVVTPALASVSAAVVPDTADQDPTPDPTAAVVPTPVPTGHAYQPEGLAGPPTATPAVTLPRFAEEVAAHAQAVSGGNTHEFRMRLDPPELGEVSVRLIASGDRVHAEVLVGDDGVRRMIESQLPDLRQRLEAAGLQVSGFDVNTRSGDGGQGNPPWDRPVAGVVTPGRTTAPPAAPRWRPAPSPTGGALDVTA